MTTILKSAPVIEAALNDLKERCDALKAKGVTPSMKVILVGEHAPSLIYTRNKKRFVEKFGGECEIVKLPESISPEKFVEEVKAIGNNDSVHGCFVQLPLPKQLSSIDVAALIPPKKDIDGFTKEAFEKLLNGARGDASLIPCTPKGIITLLEHYGITMEGKRVTVIGRSLIVGKPMFLLMNNHNATVTMCHSRTPDIKSYTKESDIVVVAVGKAKFLDASYFNESKNTVVVDVGMNKDENGKLCGDVDFESVKPISGAITPVPGGVGPLTILSLAQNLIGAAEEYSS